MSKEINDGGSAFPQIKTIKQYSTDIDMHSVGGMTLRDYFAAKTIQIAWDAAQDGYFESDDTNRSIAECAYQIADAMLKVREVQS